MVYLILCEGPRLSAYDVGCSSLWLILDPASELREFPGSCPLQTEPHQWSLYACSTSVTDTTVPLSDTCDLEL